MNNPWLMTKEGVLLPLFDNLDEEVHFEKIENILNNYYSSNNYKMYIRKLKIKKIKEKL